MDTTTTSEKSLNEWSENELDKVLIDLATGGLRVQESNLPEQIHPNKYGYAAECCHKVATAKYFTGETPTLSEHGVRYAYNHELGNIYLVEDPVGDATRVGFNFSKDGTSTVATVHNHPTDNLGPSAPSIRDISFILRDLVPMQIIDDGKTQYLIISTDKTPILTLDKTLELEEKYKKQLREYSNAISNNKHQLGHPPTIEDAKKAVKITLQSHLNGFMNFCSSVGIAVYMRDYIDQNGSQSPSGNFIRKL